MGEPATGEGARWRAKDASKEINAALEVGRKTSEEIALAREAYRKQASEPAGSQASWNARDQHMTTTCF